MFHRKSQDLPIVLVVFPIACVFGLCCCAALQWPRVGGYLSMRHCSPATFGIPSCAEEQSLTNRGYRPPLSRRDETSRGLTMMMC